MFLEICVQMIIFGLFVFKFNDILVVQETSVSAAHGTESAAKCISLG